MPKIIIIFAFIVLLAGCSLQPVAKPKQLPVNTNQFCTQEAKLCPDGSAVSRTGPNCEFALCPGENQNTTSTLSEAQARVIAEKTCIKGGEALANGVYNEITKTWWFDANLNATKAGCNPACVVDEATKTAEINWRCTGLILPNK
ncbi:MAG: hypothetical protein NTX00_04540 [Candidatus Parcubacteria bacterium]|nr:hypothetical protein [Candidatus Parcubacteria bacterium]